MYHYAANNPVRYTDPDGRFAFLAVAAPIFVSASTVATVKAMVAFVGSLIVCGVAGYAIGTTAVCVVESINVSKNGTPDDISQNLKSNVQIISSSLKSSDNDNDENGEPDENKTPNEHKKPKSGTGKEKANDIPSWAEGETPYKNESGKDFAKRLMDKKYGKDNYDKGPDSEFNKLKKWGDRGFD